MAIKINTNLQNDYDGYLLDAENVKGSMINVDAVANLPSGSATIVNGSVAFVRDTKKFYTYNGSSWVEIEMGGGSQTSGNGMVIVEIDYETQVNQETDEITFTQEQIDTIETNYPNVLLLLTHSNIIDMSFIASGKNDFTSLEGSKLYYFSSVHEDYDFRNPFFSFIQIDATTLTGTSNEVSVKDNIGTGYSNNSAKDIPTAQAVKTYVQEQIVANGSGTSTSTLSKLKVGSTTYSIPSGPTPTQTIDTSTTNIPSSNAVKSYVDEQVGDIATILNELANGSGVN